MIKFLYLKRRVNKEGLRLSRACEIRVNEIVEEVVAQAIEVAKAEEASQLNPEHFGQIDILY